MPIGLSPAPTIKSKSVAISSTCLNLSTSFGSTHRLDRQTLPTKAVYPSNSPQHISVRPCENISFELNERCLTAEWLGGNFVCESTWTVLREGDGWDTR